MIVGVKQKPVQYTGISKKKRNIDEKQLNEISNKINFPNGILKS